MNFEQQHESPERRRRRPDDPFGPTGASTRRPIKRIIRRLVECGITTVTPNGNTGEFYALAPAEAKVVTATCARGSRPGNDGHGRRRSRRRFGP